MFIFLYTSNNTGSEVVNQLQILNVLFCGTRIYTRPLYLMSQLMPFLVAYLVYFCLPGNKLLAA